MLLNRETVLMSWNTGNVRNYAIVFNFVSTPLGGATTEYWTWKYGQIWGWAFRQVQSDRVNRSRRNVARKRVQHVYCDTACHIWSRSGNECKSPQRKKLRIFAQQSRSKCIYPTRKIWRYRIHHWYIPSCQDRPWSVNGNGYVSPQFQNLVNIVVFLLFFFSPPPLVRIAYSSRCVLQRVEVSNATKTKYEFKYIDWNSRNVTPDFTENSKADRS